MHNISQYCKIPSQNISQCYTALRCKAHIICSTFNAVTLYSAIKHWIGQNVTIAHKPCHKRLLMVIMNIKHWWSNTAEDGCIGANISSEYYAACLQDPLCIGRVEHSSVMWGKIWKHTVEKSQTNAAVCWEDETQCIGNFNLW